MLWLFLIGFLLFLGFVYAWLWKKITGLRPESYPTPHNILKSDSTEKTLVCFGDSITHGNVSYDWVSDLAEAFTGIRVLNAGVNSDLTYSLLERIGDVIASEPDFIAILIGTNDVNATLSSESLNNYKQLGRIKKETKPDFSAFKKNYHEIVNLLKGKTKAKIALVSLPVMGEDLAHPANLKADEYSTFIEQLAAEKKVAYVPFREKEKEYLSTHPQTLSHTYEETTRLFTFSLINRFILGKDWDYISKKHGYRLTPDNLHLNSVSGGMIRDLIKEFIIFNHK